MTGVRSPFEQGFDWPRTEKLPAGLGIAFTGLPTGTGWLGCHESRRRDVGRIVVMNHVTLDGVMQGPGRPEEDTRGGFTHGGWGHRSTTAGDAAGKAMGERMAAGGGLSGWLFGRRTYRELLSFWNAQGGPFKDALNDSSKYVASTSLAEPLAWPNSTLLRGDISEAVRALRARSSGVLAIMGSGQLIGSLMAADLIDEYLLIIHPLVLGVGRRLFPENVLVPLRLTNSASTPSGVVIATYEPERTDEARGKD
jgi:dihydrofolate reductase